MDRVMLIANLFAGSVSRRTREVITKALSADFKLEVGETAGRNHATDLAREAVDGGFDAVLVLGGDGTINEVAQALVETDTALGILPGGSTNVMARSLGVPEDPVDAAAFAVEHVRTRSRRRVNVGRLDERYFLFSGGIGLDAEVVRRIEEDPEAKKRWGEWAFVSNAVKAAISDYRRTDPMIRVTVEDETFDVVLCICCNARPLTYFKRWPVDACPSARLDAGLDLFALEKITGVTIPRITWSVFVSRSHVGWRRSHYFHDISAARVAASRPLPVQVDGDYIGERSSAAVHLVPDALDLLV